MKTILLILITFSIIQAKEANILNSNSQILNIDINDIPKCSDYKQIKKISNSKTMRLPLFNYKNRLIGTSSNMMIFKDRYAVCKINDIIKIRHIETTELEHIKDHPSN